MFGQQQAEGIFGGQVLGTRGAFADQRRQGKALASRDLEGGLGATPRTVRALTVHAALFDDVEVLDRAIAGFDDRVTFGIEAQLAVLDQIRQVSGVHLVKGGNFCRNSMVPWMF